MTADTSFLTAPEISKLLRCRQSKVTNWIRSGKLQAVNLSDGQRPRYRVARTALDDFLAAQAVVPESKPARRQRREKPTGYVEYV
jgi:excisionase family DNA binding protein